MDECEEITDIFVNIFNKDLLIKLLTRQVLKDLMITKCISNQECLIAVDRGRIVGILIFGRFNDNYYLLIFKSLFRNLTSFYNFVSSKKNIISCMYLIAYSIFNKKYNYKNNLKWICVINSHLRNGIGTMLIQEFKSKNSEKGESIFVRTLANSEKNINFYLKNGFKLRKRSFGRVLLEWNDKNVY
jgi:GNAT superfamily N-acetyltransferase